MAPWFRTPHIFSGGPRSKRGGKSRRVVYPSLAQLVKSRPLLTVRSQFRSLRDGLGFESSRWY